MSWRSFLRNWSIGSAAIVGVSVAAPMFADADAVTVPPDVVPYAGMQGIDTALLQTDSAETYVETRDNPFKGLEITVNQTEHLNNQAIGVTWSGATPTSGLFGSHFLQMMQCWGDPVEAADGTEGPPPEQCVFGAFAGVYGGPPANAYPLASAISREISIPGWANYDPEVGKLDPATQSVWRPFRSVTGEEIVGHVNPNFRPIGAGFYWLNPFFDVNTTNEVAGARTYADQEGSEIFQVLTGVQSSGLGCGQSVQHVGADVKVPRCWLVIVPRGEEATENTDTPYEALQVGVVATSPLGEAAWRNRIAFELHFNPVDSRCAFGADERRIVGNDLAVSAVSSWQPVLCGTSGLPPFSYAPAGDPLARQQIVNPAPGGAGMAVVGRPADHESVGDDRQLVYAPLTASGIVIGFNIERRPRDSAKDEAPLAGKRVAELNFTPRLVAKLLTQSYNSQLDMYVRPGYGWAEGNPYNLLADPDFLRFNPEFNLLQAGDRRTIGGLQLPTGSSDAAALVWEWILSDPEAAAWLAGEPDEYGMQVNPYYSTDPEINPTGAAFGEPAPVNFPKSDPYCYQPPARSNGVVPTPLCGTEWMPYGRNFFDTARVARAASDSARINLADYPQSPSQSWQREAPQYFGIRSMLAVTDSPSAVRFGLQTARLSRAGDNGDDRVFVAPDAAGLLAAVSAMPDSEVSGVVVPDPATDAADAYPLTIVSYAVSEPLRLDDDARHDYAAFVRYAVGAGQAPGSTPGDLPFGYVPLPDVLRARALAAAEAIETLKPTPTTTTTTEPPSSTSTTSTSSTTNTTVADVTTTSEVVPPVPDPPQPNTPQPGAPRPGSGGGSTVPVADQGDTDESFPATTVASEVTPPGTTGPAATDPAESPAVGTAPPAATPLTELGRSRLAVPGLGVIALGSALGALEISKRPRRASASPSTDDSQENM